MQSLNVEQDFNYYQRTMKTIYITYYRKQIAICLGILLALCILFFILDKTIFILFVFPIFFGVIFYYYSQSKNFDVIYHSFLAYHHKNFTVQKIKESEYYYLIIDSNSPVKLTKKTTRNLPSPTSDLTILIGFKKIFFAKQPFQIIYYNHLDLSYDESYRIKKTRY